MSKASRAFKARSRKWNRMHTEKREPDFVNPRRSGSLRGYRAHRRRIQMYGEDIFSLFW